MNYLYKIRFKDSSGGLIGTRTVTFMTSEAAEEATNIVWESVSQWHESGYAFAMMDGGGVRISSIHSWDVVFFDVQRKAE